MKTQTKRERFVELRAEGKSYAAIAQQLQISKSTCSEWEAELSAELRKAREDRWNSLYETYKLSHEARIARLSKTLQKIDDALEQVDFTKFPPAQLLEWQLKYAAELKQEFVAPHIAAGLPDDLQALLNKE